MLMVSTAYFLYAGFYANPFNAAARSADLELLALLLCCCRQPALFLCPARAVL